jgi:hypothetical protein
MVAEVASIDEGDTSPELGFRALRENSRERRDWEVMADS